MGVSRLYGLYRLLSVVFFLAATPAYALLVDLDAYVDFPILQEDGVTPLADGSWVYIIGSTDSIIDPMQMVGTNFIAGSVTGDDVILGIVRIGDGAVSNSGTFFSTVRYESDEINYVYIRFFNSTDSLTGLIWWGTSAMFQLGVTLGVATVVFDQGTNLITDNEDNFVIIPEPNTIHLFVLVAGMFWAMRARMRRVDEEGERENHHDDPPSTPQIT
ncbi:MAG TPA: hypothetical protein PJ991_03850 [Kiritimatiellia bacterium]|nr:hypothetical protein [Kiritimatiellia bacterium]